MNNSIQKGILRDTVIECFKILAKHKYDVGKIGIEPHCIFLVGPTYNFETLTYITTRKKMNQ